VSYGKEVDIASKLNNYLKIKGFIKNMFRPQKTLKETRIKLSALLYGSDNWIIKAADARSKSSRHETYEKNSRIHLDRLQNKHRDCKEINITTVWGKIQENEKKLFAIHKQNAP
jgi:hypothetical protein